MAGKKLRPFSNTGYKDEDIMPLSFDTETDGLGGPLLCLTAHCPDKAHYFRADQLNEFFDLLVEHPYPYIWYAHSAQYDWRYFLEYIKDNMIYCAINMRNETDIYQIMLFMDGERIVMRDSLAIFPGTLRQFADCFTPEIPKGHIDFDSGERFNPDDEAHREYALRDAQILRHGLPRFNSMLMKHFGVTLGHTTAGTALKAWQATLADGEFYQPSEYGDTEQFIRSGYYGGLVFLTRNDEIENAETIDINSSYPYQMCEHGVPWGNSFQSKQWRSDCPGIFRVEVIAPDDLIIPVLPSRNEKGHMQWRRGRFETVVTNKELMFAERHGYEIINVIEGIQFEQMVFPFTKFINRCKSIRNNFKGRPEETLAKLMQNSLYGKFGSRRERFKIYIPDNDDERMEGTPIDDDGYFWSKAEFAENLRCIPEWAVFITAHARLHLLETAYGIGVENVIYGDTDSLTILPGHRGRINIGNEYGQFKLEKEWQRFRAQAPKVYAGITKDGKFKGAAKGLPKKKMDDNAWRQLLNGERVRIDYETLPSLRVSMEKGIYPAKPISRISTDLNNAANWQVENNRIQPRTIS